MTELVQKVRNAGVVGAGGAGFPSYKKIDAKVKTVIANGAECEPLLYKDKAIMENYPEQVIQGLLAVMENCSAEEGIIAIKSKNRKSISALTEYLSDRIRIMEMEDVYPAGDEFEVVYHCTGKRIPAGGIPLQIGVIVQNVETLYNIYRASRGYSVTHSMMTIHGEVNQPITAWFPLGMSYSDLIDIAGGATVSDFVLIDGGPMMGRVITDLSTPVTRTSSGLIVVPRESHLAVRKSQPEKAFKRFGKSACDQCSDCTEMCPRYLLGYPIQPHLVMRSLLTTNPMSDVLTPWAQACCECNICSLWACPEGLDPRNVCVSAKRDLKKNSKWLSAEELQKLMSPIHQMQKYRKVPTTLLTRRLGLQIYTREAPFTEVELRPDKVTIPIRQHIGEDPVPVVSVGDEMLVGDVLALPSDNALSVPVHSSINGVVEQVGESIVIRSF